MSPSHAARHRTVLQRPSPCSAFFFFMHTAPTEIYTLSLHDALPIYTRLFYARWLVVGRLKTGVSFLQAQAEIDSLFAHLAQSDPDPNRSLVRVFPLGLNLSDNTRLALFVLFGAVISVLLIACSNVANLVLARGAGRTHEMALRTAFGAGRGRLTRQLFTESALLALVSGCLGLLLASFCLHTLIAFGPPDIPRLDEAW